MNVKFTYLITVILFTTFVAKSQTTFRSALVKESRFQLNLEFEQGTFELDQKYKTKLSIFNSKTQKLIWSYKYDEKLITKGNNVKSLFITDTLNTKIEAYADVTVLGVFKVNHFKHYMASTLFPGATINQLDGKNHLLNGVIGYLLIGGAVATNYLTNDTYSKYLSSKDIDNRNDFYKKAQLYRFLTLGISGTASLVWIKNYIGIARKSRRLNDDNVEELSPHYYKKLIAGSKTYQTPVFNFDLRDDETILYELASSQMMSGKLDEAFSTTAALLKVNPSNSKSVTLKKEIESRILKNKNDKIAYKKHISQSEIAIKEKNWDEAKRILKLADNIYPGNLDLTKRLNNVFHLEKQEQLDIECQRLIKQGDNLIAQNNYDEALNRYDKALNLNHCNRLAQNRIDDTKNDKIKELSSLADQLFNEEKFDQAKQKYQVILTIDPRNIHAFNKISEIERLTIYNTNEWSIEEELYRDGRFKVDIRFYVVSNACSSYESTFQYRLFNIRNKKYGVTKLSFDLDYINCSGRKVTKTYKIDISEDPTGSGGHIDGISKIRTEKITRKPYNVRLN